jgi:4-carboxymuconolactone decarboxylase
VDELRRKGLQKMNEVYGWEMPDMPGDYFALTADHLFGTIWSRPGLGLRDRRLMLLAVLTAQGQDDLLDIQVNAALHNDEMTVEELREAAIFITHYVGFPLGSKLNSSVERVRAKRKKAGDGSDARAAAEDAIDKVARRPKS